MVGNLSRRCAWLGLLLASGLALAACGGGSAQDPAGSSTPAGDAPPAEGVSVNDQGGEALALGDPVQGGRLRVGLSATLETLDPTGPINQSLSSVAGLVYDSLLTLDGEGRAVPEAAESMESEDGQQWTLTLPANLTFTDGTPFDARAVIAHVENLAAEGSRSQAAGDVRRIASMTAVDDRTVEFTLDQPWTGFDKVFARGSAAYVPSPTAFTERGDGFGINPVGAGPFLVESFQPGGNLELVRNPDYRLDDVPYLDAMTFVPAVDTNARLGALRNGDLDVGTTRSATEVQEAEAAGLTVLDQPDTTYSNVLLNLTRPPFDDVRFRRAVIQGIDLEGLSTAVFGGAHEPVQGLFPPDHPFATESDWPPFDPEAARALVAEYTSDTGEPAAFTLTMPPPADMQRQATIIQQMLEDVGITVELDPQDNPTMVSSALAGNYHAQVRFIAVYAETDQVLTRNFSSRSGGNNGGAGDPEFDRLLDEARTVDPGGREDLYRRIQHRFAEWLAMIPLLVDQNAIIVGPGVGGFPGAGPNGIYEAVDWRYAWAAQ